MLKHPEANTKRWGGGGVLLPPPREGREGTYRTGAGEEEMLPLPVSGAGREEAGSTLVPSSSDLEPMAPVATIAD